MSLIKYEFKNDMKAATRCSSQPNLDARSCKRRPIRIKQESRIRTPLEHSKIGGFLPSVHVSFEEVFIIYRKSATAWESRLLDGEVPALGYRVVRDIQSRNRQ
jgi:hypothetical protein